MHSRNSFVWQPLAQFFPDRSSVIRLAGSLLTEVDDEWQYRHWQGFSVCQRRAIVEW
jgi:hypothetical protein